MCCWKRTLQLEYKLARQELWDSTVSPHDTESGLSFARIKLESAAKIVRCHCCDTKWRKLAILEILEILRYDKLGARAGGCQHIAQLFEPGSSNARVDGFRAVYGASVESATDYGDLQ